MARRNSSEPPPHAPEAAFEHGLPCNLDAEKCLLGAVLLNYASAWPHLESLDASVFSLEKHKRIFLRMQDLAARGEAIDYVTLADSLSKASQLESIDGLSGLMKLTEGLPEIPNPKNYVTIVLEKHALRCTIFAAQQVIDKCFSEQQQSSDILDGAGEKFQSIRLSDAREYGGRTTGQIVEDFPGGVGSFLDPTLRTKGLLSGYTKFDELTGGFRPDDFIILAARPAMGKTAIALNIAHNIASRTEPELMDKIRRGGTLGEADRAEIFGVSFFSLEMSGSSLVERLLCGTARVDQQRFRGGYLNKEERNSLQSNLAYLSDVPLFINDNPGSGLDRMAQQLRRDVKDRGVKLAIVDYIGLMSSKAENRQNEVSKISRGMKLLAKELGIPFMALSQLNRAVDTRAGGSFIPALVDLRDSGSLEQDADLVTFLVREEVYKKDREDLKGLADLYIGKQRNGPIGKVPLRFIGQYTRFENLRDDMEPAEESS